MCIYLKNKISNSVLDTQAIRNKITFTTTLGLVVHAAGNIKLYNIKLIQHSLKNKCM